MSYSSLGKRGDYKANVLKINIPRNDVKVTVDGVATPTPFGFGGWLAMTKGDGGQDVMMGDLVLVEDEVNPVMSALLDNGIEVTALHNHFFFDEPHMFFMHVMAHGTAAELARNAKPAVDLIGHVAQSHPSSGSATVTLQPGKLDTGKIAKIVGHEGEQSGAVYKITIGRDDLKLKELGATINARMGLNTWAAFVGNDEFSECLRGGLACAHEFQAERTVTDFNETLCGDHANSGFGPRDDRSHVKPMRLHGDTQLPGGTVARNDRVCGNWAKRRHGTA